MLIFGLGMAYAKSFCVPQSSPELQVTPEGYTYRGKPFGGIIYILRDNFWPTKIALFYQGKRHGAEIHWYPNGQRWIERQYEEGREKGTHMAWYPDGSVKYIKHFHQGKPHGDFMDWHSNGTLSQFVRYEHGREIAAKSWTAGGKPFYNYTWRNGERVGIEGDSFCSPRSIKF